MVEIYGEKQDLVYFFPEETCLIFAHFMFCCCCFLGSDKLSFKAKEMKKPKQIK